MAVTRLRMVETATRLRHRKAIADIEASGLFDREFYLQHYPDVAASGADPLLHYVRSGWRERRDPNPLFSTSWYLATHHDVAREGVNPLLHYVRTGALEMRDTSAQYRPSLHQDHGSGRGVHHLAISAGFARELSTGQAMAVAGAAGRVLLIAELSLPQCRKYRVDQKVELFRRLGVECIVVDWRDAGPWRAAIKDAAMAIFYRVPDAPSIRMLIAAAKATGTPLFWEVDDLIFDPNEYLKNDNLGTLSVDLQEMVLSGVPAYRRAMIECGRGIASTHCLAEAMREAGVGEVFVVENALDRETAAIASRIAATPRRGDGLVRIVYGSGSKAHDVDFLEAAPAVAACMGRHPGLRLRVIGDLTLPGSLASLENRIERFEGVPYATYLDLLAQGDIAIAPLAPSIFNDAKSNIKFIEAAMVGLPSVCSPRSAFVEVVQDGENGLLADDQSAWEAAFERLVADPALRQRLGGAAQTDVKARYAPERVAREQLAALLPPDLLVTKQAGRDGGSRRLRVLVANIFYAPRAFGGATVVAEALAKAFAANDEVDISVFAAVPLGVAAAYDLTTYTQDHVEVLGVGLPDVHDPKLVFDNPYVLSAWRAALRLNRPDVVHIHCVQGLGVGLLDVCAEEGVPFVVTLHDAWWICGRQFMVTGEDRYCGQWKIDLNVCSACVGDPGVNVFRQFRLRKALLKARRLLTPSRFFRDLYAANDFPPERIFVNGNGVTGPGAAYRRRGARDKISFGFVGGEGPIKGADSIRKAFASLDRDDYRLVIVDNTINLGFSSTDAKAWRVRGELEIVPAYTQATMDEFYSKIDVLLFPTKWKESFGLTVREALLRDIWVIATDAGGVVEDIVEGVNGDIIPLSDDGTALAAAISRRLDRRETLRTYVNPHKDRISDYDKQASELLAILKDVVAEAAAERDATAETPSALPTPA